MQKKIYSYDPHLDPALVWAGKSEHTSFEIPTVSLHVHERIWARDSVLNLIQHFIQVVEEEDDKGKKTGERSLIFPRYHQLDSVRRLVADVRVKGPGQNYLIQHSAGSGKSNSIAWLAHQLSVLHDNEDRRNFDSIIIYRGRDQQLCRDIF
jgi:type I restriction enzyme R subunit